MAAQEDQGTINQLGLTERKLVAVWPIQIKDDPLLQVKNEAYSKHLI